MLSPSPFITKRSHWSSAIFPMRQSKVFVLQILFAGDDVGVKFEAIQLSFRDRRLSCSRQNTTFLLEFVASSLTQACVNSCRLVLQFRLSFLSFFFFFNFSPSLFVLFPSALRSGRGEKLCNRARISSSPRSRLAVITFPPWEISVSGFSEQIVAARLVLVSAIFQRQCCIVARVERYFVLLILSTASLGQRSIFAFKRSLYFDLARSRIICHFSSLKKYIFNICKSFSMATRERRLLETYFNINLVFWESSKNYKRILL